MTRMSVLEAWTWINEYGSAIGAVAGVVAALVAIIALISAALDSKARSQPMIAAEFRPAVDSDSSIDFIITNLGPTPARDITVTFNPPIVIPDDSDRLLAPYLVKRYERPIPVLNPGQILSNTWWAGRAGTGNELTNHEPTPDEVNVTKIYAAAHRARTVFYTPEVSATMRALQEDLRHDMIRTERCIEEHLVLHGGHVDHAHGPNPSLLELIIIDESERLTGNAIEWLRDQYDRTGIAMILIGMPGIEKQFTHYPQLYSRLGFAHQYRPLGHDELLFVLERQWRKLGKTLDPDDFTDAQAIAAVERITRGNFRLLERLLPQIQRVLKINELYVITNDVVEAARSTLVIGTT